MDRALDLAVGRLGSGLSLSAISPILCSFICKRKIILKCVALVTPIISTEPCLSPCFLELFEDQRTAVSVAVFKEYSRMSVAEMVVLPRTTLGCYGYDTVGWHHIKH